MKCELTRRDVLIGAAGAAASAFGGGLGKAVSFRVPGGACDCHTHVFGDPAHFPFTPSRTYTPGPAPVDEMRALHRSLQVSRVVIVQPSVYGTDNACMLDAIRQLGPRARGIAVIGEGTSDADLDRMHRAGIRGIRVNLETAGQTDPAIARQRFLAATTRIARRPWHVQVFTRPSVIAALADDLRSAPVPIVFDHFGGAQGAGGVEQPGFDVLRSLVQAGSAYVKLSAPYRGSSQGPDYPDMVPLAKALVAANPKRILWGSDWPHPNTSPDAPRTPAGTAPRINVDEVQIFNRVADWAPDASLRKLVLVDNPAGLYAW
ncbi:MAG TPA: amidohydrolase family protein [Vicinamibacterales bacterium]|nr:amidohydrolase family protein [Vicinamibacterales bacterium]